ncbi:MAG: nucleotide exchange factor GrpE [Bacteroidaceae bacterium]|nr:nucleotide exchange factor GrpE [Bacteroidaceae bacterium]
MAKEKKDNEELKNETKSQEEVKTSEACEEKDAATASETAEQEIEVDPLEKAEAEIADLKKQLLYKIAEFDNYRKRTMAEKVELIMNGGEKTITAILPVMDDMERALEQMKKAEDVSAVVEGVELIRKKFMGILEKLGVKAIETEGAEFNVDLHEAIAQLPAPSDEMKNKIMDCTLKGYKLNDKVIRHSQVVVGM